MGRRCRWLVVWIALLTLAGAAFPARAQAVSIAVQAGFDGLFRENEWLPLYVQVGNDGASVEGRLLVRPETSGSGINNTYSLPISLPEGARKTAFLYISARSFTTQVRVELVDAGGVVIASQTAGLRAIETQDQLAVVISEAVTGTVDLTKARGGYAVFQANWSVENLPDRATALETINLILFDDVDTGLLSAGQRAALADWVAMGGHLLVTGGPNWQATAAGLNDLLPVNPQASATLSDLSPLAAWVRADDKLAGATVIATGEVRDGARVLVGAAAVPLIVRRTLGAGTVDYLAFDPQTQPARGWSGLSDLWLALMTSVNPGPGWLDGIYNWDQAVSAANVMPGVNLLPDILPLCGFLALYIGLIGPVNYLVLNRINRRELAWLTIPLFIVLFSALSWLIGANLRGSEVTISRTAVVQSWPDAQNARVETMIGLLSPRRDRYSLAVFEDSFLRPVPLMSGQGSLLSGSVQASADVQQAEFFRAADFPVDASFIAAFNARTFVPRPEINGQARLFYDGLDGQQVLRGSVRNDTDQTLHDPVILARGTSLRLEAPLEPGDVATFDLTLPGEGLPPPARVSYAPGSLSTLLMRSSARAGISQTINDILGTRFSEWSFYGRAGGTPAEKEAYRRRLFLASFISDAYSLTTGRGSQVYLAAWAGSAPMTVELDSSPWTTLDTTLYLAQFAVEIEKPAGETFVSAEQFTWTAMNSAGLNPLAPYALALEPGGEAVFRYTPLPDAVLRQVRELTIRLDRNTTISRNLPLQIWNWETDAWEDLQVGSGKELIIRDPARYLGPHNAVQLRVLADTISGYPRLQDLSVEQRGRF
ncbi:MAG: hypothetical protein HXY41_07480 [Chloroflexi bacterium]|nr:hypothetical protein [Chloroflexota bacterium]